MRAPATSSSSAARSARRVRASAAAVSHRRRSVSPRVAGSAPSRPRCSISLTGSRRTRRTSPCGRAAGCAIDLDSVPLADGATVDDVGFGEDYELLAATPDALGFAVIGRCEEGAGVTLTLGGEPYALSGWEHFR